MDTLTCVTDEEIVAEIEKNPIKIHWDYDASIGMKELSTIVNGGQEALDKYEEETLSENQEYLWEQERELTLHLQEKWRDCEFAALGEDASPTDKDQHIQTLVSENTASDANISRLAKLTGRQYFTVRACEPAMFQSCRGIEQIDCLDEILELLQISPHHYQDLVRPGSNIILPTIPDREGKNAVDIDGFRGVLKETMYGGELVFLCGMETSHVIETLNGFHTQPIRVHKGTLVMINDYACGCPSMDDTPLIRDLVIPQEKGKLHFDTAHPRGIQNCCQMTPKPWLPGFASPEDPEC